MTINQAHNYIKLELDKTSSLELPAFVQEEIDYWLDDAILRFVKHRKSGNNVKGESFEQSQKRIDDLRLLVAEGVSTPSSAGTQYENSVTFEISDFTDYLYSLREDVEITYSGGSAIQTSITPTNHDKVNFKINDPLSEQNTNFGKAKPLRLFTGDTITLIGDGTYTMDNLRSSYIKIPIKVDDVTPSRDTDYPDLTDSAMHEVVKLAANSMIENIESQRYQSHTMETIQSE